MTPARPLMTKARLKARFEAKRAPRDDDLGDDDKGYAGTGPPPSDEGYRDSPGKGLTPGLENLSGCTAI